MQPVGRPWNSSGAGCRGSAAAGAARPTVAGRHVGDRAVFVGRCGGQSHIAGLSLEGSRGGTSHGQEVEAPVSASFSVHTRSLSPLPGHRAAGARAQAAVPGAVMLVLAERLGLMQYPRPLEASLTLPRPHSLPLTPSLSPPLPAAMTHAASGPACPTTR